MIDRVGGPERGRRENIVIRTVGAPRERGDERTSVYRKGGREAYQGGGEDGEEDAEAEDDAVARGLGEDRDAAEEAASGKSTSMRSAAIFFFFFSGVSRDAKAAGRPRCARAIEWEIPRVSRVFAWSGSWGRSGEASPGILRADSVHVGVIFGEAGSSGGLSAGERRTGVGHGGLSCARGRERRGPKVSQ